MTKRELKLADPVVYRGERRTILELTHWLDRPARKVANNV